MKIVIISDTHNYHKHLGELPEADMIIHCGDMTGMGHEHEIRNFMKWFSKLDQYSHRICCAGNHDWLFQKNNLLARELVPDNVIYLEDEEIIIEGIKFYGSPVQLPFNNWAFNKPEYKLIPHWQAIPDDTDVLITHSPPRTVFDWSIYDNIHTGSPSLYYEIINRIKPLVSAFGHIHSGHGVKVIENTTFINASNLNEEYVCEYDPIIIEIVNNTVIYPNTLI